VTPPADLRSLLAADALVADRDEGVALSASTGIRATGASLASAIMLEISFGGVGHFWRAGVGHFW
jgi:hypothetical protein